MRTAFAVWHGRGGFVRRLVVRCLQDHNGSCTVGEICAGTSLCERTVKFVLVEMVMKGFVMEAGLCQFCLVRCVNMTQA